MSWGESARSSKSSSDNGFDRREFLLNIGLLMAAISFLTAFVGLKIGGIRIAYKYYQYVYLYVILLSSLRYGMVAGITSSLALGFLTITASEVLPQFREMQDIPTSPNVQLVLYVIFAYLAAFSMEKDKVEIEDLQREVELLRRENENLASCPAPDDSPLPEVFGSRSQSRPSSAGQPSRRPSTRPGARPQAAAGGRKIELDRPDAPEQEVSQAMEPQEPAIEEAPAAEKRPRVIKMRAKLMNGANEQESANSDDLT